MLEIHGTSMLSELFGDWIVFRNLVPADPRLPSLEQLRERLGLPGERWPRKHEPEYGRVVAEILCQARRLTGAGTPLKRLVYLGDTRMSDGAAFGHICSAGGWDGRAFIGDERPGEPAGMVAAGPLVLSNRWSLLPEFFAGIAREGFAAGEAIVLVVDIDKTAIGARGRNSAAIDAARLEGIRRTLDGIPGQGVDRVRFQAAYEELNRPVFHAFTADNQDYLVYICLLAGAGMFRLDHLLDCHRRGARLDFQGFMDEAGQRRPELEAAGLAALHDAFVERFRSGDPTPFKEFRRQEYLATRERFGGGKGVSVEQARHGRIAITAEVRSAVLHFRRHGALVFALSDKPDEAAGPFPAPGADAWPPLHRLPTVVLGERPG